MSKTRLHFVKVGEFAEPFVRSISLGCPLDWKSHLFADLFAAEKARVFALRANAVGETVGIAGEAFFVEAGQDRYRADTLFIHKVTRKEDADELGEPMRYDARFYSTSDPEYHIRRGDPVEAIFHSSRRFREQTDSQTLLAFGFSVRDAIAQAPDRFKKLWRPDRVIQDPEHSDVLQSARRTWSKHRLALLCEATPRIETMLNGQIRSGDESDIHRIRDLLLSEGLINRYMAEVQQPSYLYSLLEDLGDLQPDERYRASIWIHTVRNQPTDRLIAIVRPVIENDAIPPIWRTAILESLRTATSKDQDNSIGELIDNAVDDGAAINELSLYIASRPHRSAPAERSKPPPSDEKRPDEGVETQADPTFGDVTTSADSDPPLALSENEYGESDHLDTEDLPAVEAPEEVQAWLIKRTVRILFDRDSWQTTLEESISDLRGREPESFEDIRSLIDAVETTQDHIERLHTGMQSIVKVVREELTTAAVAHQEALELLGSSVSKLMTSEVSGRDLSDIVALLRDPEALNLAPVWAKPNADAEPSLLEWAVFLTNPTRRRRARLLVGILSDFGVVAATMLRAPPTSDDVDGYITQVAERLRASNIDRENLPDIVLEASDQLARANLESDVVHEAFATVVQLHARLEGPIFDALVQRLPAEAVSKASLVAFCEGLRRASDFFDDLGGAKDVAPSMFFKWLERHSTDPQAERLQADVNIEHVRFEQNAHAALSYDTIADLPFVSLRLPIQLRCSSPRQGEYRVELEVLTRHRSSWPKDAPAPEPSSIVVDETDWRATPSKEGYIHDLVLQLPIHHPDQVKDVSLSVRIGLRDASSDIIVGSADLRWTNISRWTKIHLQWPTKVDVQHVDNHPIAAQRYHEGMVNDLLGGTTIAVVAPRRFGKSTLVEYLYQACRTRGAMVAKPLVCTSLADRENSLATLWDVLSRDLEGQFEAPLGSERAGALPGRSAFDMIRRKAHELGLSVVVVLIDEAQLLFADDDSVVIGHQLKDSLERYWSSPTDAEAPRVVFGFFGLPGILERAGTNFAGLVKEYSRRDMDEEELEKLIRGVTQDRVRTAKASRSELARRSQNLFVLRQTLERIIDRINLERRAWILYRDVVDVFEEARLGLTEGRESRLAMYVRDIMNDSLDRSIWRPNESFPVAVALAKARLDGAYTVEQRIAGAEKTLNNWCRTLATDAVEQLRFSEELVKAHLEKLRAREIFTANEFRSELVEAWLIGVARSGFPLEEADREVLMRAALKRIRLPAHAERLENGTGAEASVFRFREDDVEYAARQVRLETEADRKRFIESISALSWLQRGLHRREMGAEYIFDLRSVGILENDDLIGVQVYRWVEGDSLTTRRHQLSSSVIAEIASKVALALHLIHRRGIIHRDVSPRNVILERTRVVPVLVDFGLARIATSEMRTSLNGDDCAPEVRKRSPTWTPAADIYSLGVMMLSLIDPDEEMNDQLAAIAEDCTAEDVMRRPDASSLHESLLRLCTVFELDERRRGLWTDLSERVAVRADLKKHWFRAVMAKLQPAICSVGLGMYPRLKQRCEVVADFVNQMLEAYPRDGRSPPLTLGGLIHRPEYAHNHDIEPIRVLHRFRTNRVHARQKGPDEVTADTKRLVVQGVVDVARYLETPGISDVARAVLSGFVD